MRACGGLERTSEEENVSLTACKRENLHLNWGLFFFCILALEKSEGMVQLAKSWSEMFVAEK